MLDKITDQMGFKTLLDAHGNVEGIRGAVLLMADKAVDPVVKASQYEHDEDRKAEIVRDIHSFFYGELRADLKDICRILTNILAEAQNPVAQQHALELKQLIIDLQKKIG